MDELKDTIKALRICAKSGNIIDCCCFKTCSYQKEMPGCIDALLRDAADKMERLLVEYEDAICAIDALDTSNDSLLKEIERLKEYEAMYKGLEK